MVSVNRIRKDDFEFYEDLIFFNKLPNFKEHLLLSYEKNPKENSKHFGIIERFFMNYS
jgi:hypothetical protein